MQVVSWIQPKGFDKTLRVFVRSVGENGWLQILRSAVLPKE